MASVRGIRITTALVAALVVAIAAVPVAHAQTYPARVVRIVTPYVPGGPGDLLPRALAAGLAPLLGQQVIVDNRPGASTIIAMQAVAKAPPDGYTLIFTSVTSLSINVSTFKNLPYDPVKDFAPVTKCFTTPLYLAVHPAVPARSVKELIALARARPGKLTFASGGTGTTNHLAGELFKSMAGVDMQHVPYKSAAPAMIDVMAGHVDMLFGAAGLADSQSGRVRVLAATSAKRTAAAPELPTVQEAGLPGYEATLWFGMLAPAGTPAAIVNRLSRDLGEVMSQPALKSRFNTGDFTPSTPEELAELIRREIPKWRKVLHSARVEPQ
jgi:tripartite-type tricarboxylate transporter receptor subunit TctC